MNIMDKRQLRAVMRERKRVISPSQMDCEARAVFEFIETLPQFAEATNILMYHSLPDELPTHSTIERWSKIKNIFLPRVNGDDLEIVPLQRELSRDNRFHIAEPQGEAADRGVIDLIIVPAVALDPHGNRMGRGKGYYDRLLSTTAAHTIGVALECQLVDNIPCEPHDIPLDAVVTSTQHYTGLGSR